MLHSQPCEVLEVPRPASIPPSIVSSQPVTISVGHIKRLFDSVFRLGIGEAVSRLASFLFFAYISRGFGVELLGIVALAQTVAMYVTLGTDQGLRMVGARLVARDSNAAPFVIRRVLLKRLLSCAICVLLGSAYALWGPVPQSARLYILGFVLGVIPYAFSLDWLAWGLDKYGWLGTFRGGVTVVFLIGSVIGVLLTRSTLLPITVSNGLSATLGAAALWAAWRLRWRAQTAKDVPANEDSVRRELRWVALLPLGMATILNQAFHNFDTVLLGAMSTAAEVGRYASAYKILFLVLGAYWLVTNSLYPKISRAKGGPGARKLLMKALVIVTAIGVALAAGVGLFAPVILRAVYGTDLGATGLLRILVFAIPLDFCVAMLGTVFVSRGHDRSILVATGAAAIFNIFLNSLLIPKLQGTGAAIATLVSYLFLLAILLHYLTRKPILAEQADPTAIGARNALEH